MSNMQAFHKKLFSQTGTANDYQRRLFQLTRVDRAQVLNIAGELTWHIWD